MPLFVNWLFLVGTSTLCFLEQVFDGDNKLTSSFHGRFCDLVVVVLPASSVVVGFVIALGRQIKRYPIQVRS